MNITHDSASAAILRACDQQTLVQSRWHGRKNGREVACLLGSIDPSIASAADCNGDLMPLWLAEVTVVLFDGLAEADMYPVARRYGSLVRRWGVLQPGQWDAVLGRWLVRLVDQGLDHARPANIGQPYWQAVEDSCTLVKSAIASGTEKEGARELHAAAAAARAEAARAAAVAARAAADPAVAAATRAAYAAARTASAAARTARTARTARAAVRAAAGAFYEAAADAAAAAYVTARAAAVAARAAAEAAYAAEAAAEAAARSETGAAARAAAYAAAARAVRAVRELTRAYMATDTTEAAYLALFAALLDEIEREISLAARTDHE